MPRVLLLGASGTGTSSTAKILAAKLKCFHGDSDSYFWLPTEPPFTRPRTYDEIQELLVPDLHRHPSFVLSGSFCGWGDVIIPHLQAVFLFVADTHVREQRIKEREIIRRGNLIEPGGPEYEKFNAFLQWSRGYDTGDVSRTRKLHDEWMARLSCKTFLLETSRPQVEVVNEVLAAVERL